jgi:hypothetical protein
MKSEKGITLTSLIVYVIAMTVVIGAVATMSKYFYSNIDYVTSRTEASGEYTAFNAYFTNETNKKGNSVLYCASDGSYIIFSSEHQYTFDSNSNAIYMDKSQICKNVNSCTFSYADGKVTVNVVIGTKAYTNVYKIESED